MCVNLSSAVLGEHWVGQPWCSWFALGSGCPSAAASPCTSSGFGGSALPNAVSLAQGYVEIRQNEKFVVQTQDRRANLLTSTNLSLCVWVMVCGTDTRPKSELVD